MNYWLMKSEPNAYSFDDLKKDDVEMWDGVRNYQARNNMRAMKKGDLVLFYHSNIGKEVVGIAKVVTEYYPDPTSDEKGADGELKWSLVDIKYIKPLKKPVTLAQVKSLAFFKDMDLVTKMRLSVQPVKKKHFDKVLKLGETTL